MWHGQPGSYSAVKVHVLPPRRGSLSVLENKNTVSTLYAIDMQYFSTKGKYNWGVLALGEHKPLLSHIYIYY